MPEEDQHKEHQGTTMPLPPQQHQHPNQEQQQLQEEDNMHPAHCHHGDNRNNASMNHRQQWGTDDNKNVLDLLLQTT